MSLKFRTVIATFFLIVSVPVFAGTITHTTCKLELEDSTLRDFFTTKWDGYEFFTRLGYRVITSGAEGEDRLIFDLRSDYGALKIKEGKCNPSKEDTQCFLAQIPMSFLKEAESSEVSVALQTQFQNLIPQCRIDPTCLRPTFVK